MSVIRRNPDGTWHGDMLDGLAFVKAQQDHGAQPDDARALLVGAGGAGSAIAIELLQAGVSELVIYDSDESRVAKLLDLLSDVGEGRASAGPPDPTECDLVFNASPMGMEDDDPLPVDAALLNSSMFVGDVIAGHGVTPFLRSGSSRRLQHGQRRPHGRSRTRLDGRLHAAESRYVVHRRVSQPLGPAWLQVVAGHWR